MALRHTAHGWWHEEAGHVPPLARLTDEVDADVVILAHLPVLGSLDGERERLGIDVGR